MQIFWQKKALIERKAQPQQKKNRQIDYNCGKPPQPFFRFKCRSIKILVFFSDKKKLLI